MTREQAVLVTLVAYQVVLVAIGVLSRGRTRDGADFFLGGRGLGPLVAAISASASSSSAWTLLGVSGFAWSSGASAIWLFPACVGGFALNWYVLAPALRRSPAAREALTVTEVLAGRGEDATRRAISVLASLTVLVFMTSYVASQFQGAGKTFGETFGMSMTTSILVGAAVVVFYTMVGGFWAVSLTDTLQGLLMAATAVILPVAALVAVGGFGPLADGLRAIPGEDYLSPTRGWPWAMGIGFILGLLGIGLGYPGQPHVVNRYMAMKLGDQALRRARAIGLTWAGCVYAGMLLLGLCGRVLYPDLTDPEVVMVVAANGLLPAVLAGVMIAAVLSAIMSTADSQLLVAASTITHDLRVGAAGRWSLLARSRVVVLLLCAGAVAGALYGSQEIFSRVLFAWAAMGAAFGPLLLITVWRGPVPAGATIAAMIAGFTLSVAAYSLPADPWKGAAERVLPFLVALAIALAMTRRKSPRGAEAPRLRPDGDRT